MCLATPIKIKRIEKKWAYVDSLGKEKKVNISLLHDVKKGDWILAHADLAINTLPEKEALEILELVDSCHCHI